MNTLTFTFDNTLPSNGDTIILSEIDSTGGQTNLIYTYVPVTFPIAPNTIRIVTGSPQGNFSANQLKKSLNNSLNPAIYSVVQIDNVVVVTSLTSDFAFDGGTSTFAGVTITADFTPLEDELKRINVRSPFFVLAPIFNGTNVVDLDNATFDVFIYDGVLDVSKPSTPNYTYEKKPRFLNDSNIYIDISRQVNDFINNTYTGELNNNACVFVEVNITSFYTGGTISDTKKYLALNGFNLHSENVNFFPTTDVLISNRFISVLKGESINIPFYKAGDNYNIEFREYQNVLDSQTVIDSEILNTNDIVDYITFENSQDVNNVKITNIDTGEETFIDVEVVTECIYEPIKITFVNRHGVLQDFYSYKVNKESIKSTSDEYNRSILNESVINGIPVLSYNTTEHRTREYNKQATKSIELNTGYIPEDNNVLIEELLESEYVWLTINGVVIPANLTTKNVSLLTKTNDQLIKYKLNFDFSYNEVQNIR